MRKIYLPLLICLTLSPLGGYAATGILDASTAVSSLNLLIAQYESRIKQLESENAVLKNEMVKANIKIPLIDYS
jgi:outer membrane murein-binding lipoprotein Lpp